MDWISTSESLPTGPVLIYGQGEYHVAELVDGPADPQAAFMDLHSCEPLNWPSHWIPLAQAPTASAELSSAFFAA